MTIGPSSTYGLDVSDAPICRRCKRPVEHSRQFYDLYEHMHWVCFHYEFEHDGRDPDLACKDPVCPSRMIDDDPPTDWLTDHGTPRND